MNFTIIVMILGSLGFILLGTFLLNNKYISPSVYVILQIFMKVWFGV